MIAVLGGLGAAFFFAIATVSSSRSSRMVGPPVVLAWVVLVGSVVVAPAVVIFGFPVPFGPETLFWLALSGGGNLVGLLLGYAAMQVGKVGLVAPIASTEGAIAALIAVAAGEPLPTSVGSVMIVIAVGVALTAIAPDDGAVAGLSEGGIAIAGPPDPVGRPVALAAPAAGPPRRAIVLAVAAAFAFGISLYATGRIGSEIPLVWALVPARLFGLVALTIPLAARGRLAIARPVVPFVIVSGICEVAGFASFAFGARDSIAVSAILLSQFATISAILAWVLFGERLSRLQMAGVAIVVTGVGVLAALQS